MDINELAKKTLRKFADQSPEAQAKHPVHKVVELINQTPVDMLEHDYKQGQDGSMTITFKIPSRAEQAKQKAMEQAMQQQQGQQPMLQAKPEVNDMMDTTPAGASPSPSSNVSKMPSQAPADMAAAAAVSNVQVKVAMSPAQTAKELKTKYPAGFLKSMGL